MFVEKNLEIEDYLIPENDKKLILPLLKPVCHMKITRSFYVECDNEPFVFRYCPDCIGKDDKFKFNGIEYNVELPDEVVEKYVIINCAILVKPLGIPRGYVWCGFGDGDIRNGWLSQLLLLKEGVRMVYIPEIYELKEEGDKKVKCSIISDTTTKGHFEIVIIKHINFTPTDTEMFVPEFNASLNLNTFVGYNKQSLITNLK